jgi:hypothetical protein
MASLEVSLYGLGEWFQAVLCRNRRNSHIGGAPSMKNRAIASRWMCRHLNVLEPMAEQ